MLLLIINSDCSKITGIEIDSNVFYEQLDKTEIGKDELDHLGFELFEITGNINTVSKTYTMVGTEVIILQEENGVYKRNLSGRVEC